MLWELRVYNRRLCLSIRYTKLNVANYNHFDQSRNDTNLNNTLQYVEIKLYPKEHLKWQVMKKEYKWIFFEEITAKIIA